MIFVANVLGENLIDREIPVGSRTEVVGDDGVVVLYGDLEGVSVVLVADDHADAERRIIATFGDTATIDDLQVGWLQGRGQEEAVRRLAGLCEDCGKTLDDSDRASTAPYLCDSCETQRHYDRVST